MKLDFDFLKLNFKFFRTWIREGSGKVAYDKNNKIVSEEMRLSYFTTEFVF